jgi:hypothetical protein
MVSVALERRHSLHAVGRRWILCPLDDGRAVPTSVTTYDDEVKQRASWFVWTVIAIQIAIPTVMLVLRVVTDTCMPYGWQMYACR